MFIALTLTIAAFICGLILVYYAPNDPTVKKIYSKETGQLVAVISILSILVILILWTF